MFNFKKCFVGLLGMSLFVCAVATLLPLTGRGQSNNVGGPPRFGPRAFYLTNTEHNGSQVLTACADGYHMSSVWEILDLSNLSYNTTLGFTQPDSGSGPPANTPGWIRTGFLSDGTDGNPGSANCQSWMNGGNFGTSVFLPSAWANTTSYPVTNISPWVPNTRSCSNPLRVWCVQD